MKVVIIKDNPSEDIKQLEKKYTSENINVSIISTKKFKQILKNKLTEKEDIYLFDYKDEYLYSENKKLFSRDKKIAIIHDWKKVKQIIDNFFAIDNKEKNNFFSEFKKPR